MKNKLFLFLILLFFSLLGSKTKAGNFEKNFSNSRINLHLVLDRQVIDTVKKASKALKNSKTKALIPPPLTTAGSSCKLATDSLVRVFITASGGSGDAIEWFSNQTSNTILHTGSIYGPNVSETTTFYVQSHAGSDVSIRVPVVASVYDSPPPVTLISFPSNDELCEGLPISFSAVGGGDVFEFSVDGAIVQAMSTNRTYTSNLLKKGQVVTVKTRYAVSLDGSLNETAWGKGAVEDNMLSAALSPKASQGYISAIKISPTEDKLVFGIPGKLENNRSILLFLDTKPGGFNISNYGDETNIVPSVKGFNFFNNNLSTFDSYFQADYCLAIATDDGGTNYFADIIELKTGNSTKIRLGNASSGMPSASMGVNIGNSGVNDYNRGFEVEVLKSLIGYTIGDIKFFAFTVQDDNAVDFNLTNSFLSPELTSGLDYGNGAINFNFRDPNPVVVSADALIPCYNEASISINLIEKTTIATVAASQKNCTLTSTSLGGNTPAIGIGNWSVKSGPGTVTFSNINSGDANATVSAEGIYIFTWTISNGACLQSTADVQIEFRFAPEVPTASNQTECATSPIQTLTAKATSQVGETVVWYDAPTGGNIVANPILNSLGTITYYAQSLNSTILCTSDYRAAVILTINQKPVIPISGGNKTECASSPIQTLTATATAHSGETVIWYDAPSAGNVVANPTLNSVGTITYYAESVNYLSSCTSTARTSITLTINPKLGAPVSDGNQTECATSPIQTLTAKAATQVGETVVWYDAPTGGNIVTNPILNSLGTITYYAESLNSTTLCTSDSRAAVTLIINQKPLIPISGGNKTECASSPIQTLTATATAHSGETVIWYDAPSAGNVVANPTLNSVGTINYYAETVNSTTFCISDSRTVVTLTINARPDAPPSGGDIMKCTDGTSTQTLTATAIGNSITWYTTPVGGNAIANPVQVGVGSITYYAESSSGICTSTTRTPVTLTIVGVVPNPTANNQTVCSNGTSNQTLTATAVGNTIKWYTDLVGGILVSNPVQVGVGTASYYAESSIGDCVSASRTKVILTITATPAVPIATITKQPSCSASVGVIKILSQAGVEYSSGNTFQDSPIFSDLSPGNYTISVRFKNNTSCEIKGAVQIIKSIPQQIQFEINGNCDDKEYILTATPLSNSYDPNEVSYQWKDVNGNIVGTNSNILNVSDLIASSSDKETFPLNYSLTIMSTNTNCEITKKVTVETIFCNIQKGISPDGNGSNDYFDLRLMDVKKLEIFDRYGIKVYNYSNYTDQWKGQSNKGEDLPSATYYYVIEFNNGEAKTGWIYLIR